MVSTNAGGETESMPIATARYPSDVAPAIPAFELSCPEGWVIADAPNVVLAVVDPTPARGFRDNFVVLVDRVGPDVTLEEAAAGVAAANEKRFASVRARTEERVTVAGFDAVLRSDTIETVTGGLPIAGMSAVFVIPAPKHGSTRLLFQLQGMCEPERADTFARVFLLAMETFRFSDSSPR
jgi:hypothetical protein